MKQGCNHTPVAAVRRNQSDKHLEIKYYCCDKDDKDPVTGYLVFGDKDLGLAFLLFAELPAQEDDQVLKYSQRTDHRAVKPSEDKGKSQDYSYGQEVESQAGREELEFCHPPPPVSTNPGEEQGDAHDKEGGENDTDLS